ncbi:unnamed protein product [Ectocarpus sp. 12 AP-2014]
MIRRDEASSREEARKREEALQRERERDRLRQDKVELDRKMFERGQQRRQRAAAAASKTAAAKAKEAREALQSMQNSRQHQQQQQQQQQKTRQEATTATTVSTPPSVSPVVTTAASDGNPAAEVPVTAADPPLVAVASTPATTAETTPVPPPAPAPSPAPAPAQAPGPTPEAEAVQPPVYPAAAEVAVALPQPPTHRVRARWAHPGAAAVESPPDPSGKGNGSPSHAVVVPAPTVVTSGVWEVIERRKRERAELEQAVKRREMAAAREGVKGEASGCANDLPPAPPRPAGTDKPPSVLAAAKRGDNTKSNKSRVGWSPHVSDSEEGSEDSESLPWGVGKVGGGGGKGGRAVGGKMGKRDGVAVAAAWSGYGSGSKREGNVGGGVGRVAQEGRGSDRGGEEGSDDDSDEDEADEDIHAREELLEVELQAAKTRCEELRHHLQETKSMIPATALVVVEGGGGEGGSGVRDGGRGGNRGVANVRSGGGHGRLEAGAADDNDAAKRVAAAASGSSLGRGENGGEEEEEEDEEEEDEEDEDEEDEDEDGEGEAGGRRGRRSDAEPGSGSNSRGSFRDSEYDREQRRPGIRVRRAWGQAADTSKNADVVPPLPLGAAAVEAAAAAEGGRDLGVAGGGGGGGGGGGTQGTTAQTSRGEAGLDSSEESRNSYYPYDQSQLESEAKALNGHSGMRYDDDSTNKNDNDVGKPEKLFQRRYPPPESQASASPCPASASSAPDPAHTAEGTTANAVAAGKHSQRSGTRESKRSSRFTPARADISGELPAPRHPHHGAASDTNDTGTRGRPETRTVGTVSAAAAAVERSPRAESSPSPPPTAPAGRLADRIRTLRERCCRGLGADAFESAYGYLKAQEELEELDGACSSSLDVDREERLVRGLTDIIGQNKVHYYSLIDQLIFIENTHIGSSL